MILLIWYKRHAYYGVGGLLVRKPGRPGSPGLRYQLYKGIRYLLLLKLCLVILLDWKGRFSSGTIFLCHKCLACKLVAKCFAVSLNFL